MQDHVKAFRGWMVGSDAHHEIHDPTQELRDPSSLIVAALDAQISARDETLNHLAISQHVNKIGVNKLQDKLTEAHRDLNTFKIAVSSAVTTTVSRRQTAE